MRRRATRRAVLAGGVAAAGVAGAYAAMGDRLKLFGEDGPELEAVRSDTSAINKESVKINHLLRRAGFGMTKEEYDRYQQIGLKTTIEELLAYNAVDDSEAEKAAARSPTTPRRPARRAGVGLAGAHGEHEAAAAREDDAVLARPADQPDQRRARPGRDGSRRSISTASTRLTASRTSSRASPKTRR